MRKKGTLEEWDRVRDIAANMFDQDQAPAEIAKFLGVDDQTVRQWRRLYRKGGRPALVSRKPPGRPPRLTDIQRGQLAALLERTPAQCGFDRYLWTQQLIADLIAREFGVSYHHDHIGVILREIGFTHQKPARRAVERGDGTAIDAWRRDVWPALLKKTAPPVG
jgi:transposase